MLVLNLQSRRFYSPSNLFISDVSTPVKEFKDTNNAIPPDTHHYTSEPRQDSRMECGYTYGATSGENLARSMAGEDGHLEDDN